MQAEARNFLDKISTVSWFASVGKTSDDFLTGDVAVVSSWEDALSLSISENFDNASNEAINEITMYLSKFAIEEYRQWNKKVQEIKPKIASLVRTKISEAIANEVAPHDLPDEPFAGDLLHICMALEYAKVYHSKYFEKLAYWYLNGHFPCGWQGDVQEDFAIAFQSGKLMVY